MQICPAHYCAYIVYTGAQYIIVQPTMGVTQDPARLMSPVLNASAAMCCMNFSYHMFGSSAGMTQ